MDGSEGATGGAGRARTWVAAAFAGAGLLAVLPLLRWYWPAGAGLDVTGHPIGRDFINNWLGPRLAFSGRVALLFDRDGYAAVVAEVFRTPWRFHNWGYPPFALPALWPLGLMPYGWALAAWTGLTFAGLAFVTLRALPAAERGRGLVLLALAPACLVNAMGGQNGALTGFLLLGGLLALERRPWLAGVLFGCLTYKPHLGLALPFVLLALGAWRTILSAGLTTLALAAVSLAAFGSEPWRAYLGGVSAFQFAILTEFDGFFTLMMASVYAAARTLGLPSGPAFALQAAVSVPVLAATVWAVRRTPEARARAALVACAAPLVTPYAFNYDLAALAPVVIWRLAAPGAERLHPRLLAAWVIPAAMMPLNAVGLGLGPLPVLALYLSLLAEIVRGRTTLGSATLGETAPALPRALAAAR